MSEIDPRKRFEYIRKLESVREKIKTLMPQLNTMQQYVSESSRGGDLTDLENAIAHFITLPEPVDCDPSVYRAIAAGMAKKWMIS